MDINERNKLSKYNYCYHDDKRMILYNSYIGLKSILMIEEKDVISRIKDYIENKKNILDTEMFNILKRKGYIVDKSLDENALIVEEQSNVVNGDKLVLTIIPTSACNFKCVYCYEDFQTKKMDVITQDKLLEFVDAITYNKKSMFVNWFGGEPLLAIGVIERLTKGFREICRKKRITYLAGITTNGYLLDVNRLKRLLSCCVIDYQITIDGVKEEHDRFRMLRNNNGTYDKIITNLTDISNNVAPLSA